MERGGWGGALDALSSALRMPGGSQAGFGAWGLSPEAQPQGFGTWGAMGSGREADLFDPIALFEQQANAELARMIPGMSGTMPGASGVAPSGPEWANVNQWTGVIDQAAAQYGVPPNLIRAVMKLESNGVDLGPNGATAVGPMQVTYSNWGSSAASLGYDLANPQDNILMGAYILKQNYAECGDWQGAITAYYTGDCTPSGARDLPSQGGSGMTDSSYVGQIWSTYQQLEQGSGPVGTTGGGYGGAQFTAITGGQEYAITQEQGVSGFSQANCAQFYEYATTVGLPACSHPGVDVGTPYGTALYTPVAGTVVKAGGTGFYANNGDKWTPGVGEFRLQLDNGDQLILGHMSQIGVQVGQRVNAGAYVGRSGTEGSGAHVHVEYRQAGANTSSGFQSLDPRQVFGGGFTGGGFGAPGMTPQPGFTGGNWWNRPLDQILGG